MVFCILLSIAGIKKNTNRTYLASKRKKDMARNSANAAELNSKPSIAVRKKPSR